MGTNVLGDAIKAALDALSEADKRDRTKTIRAMGNEIEDWHEENPATGGFHDKDFLGAVPAADDEFHIYDLSVGEYKKLAYSNFGFAAVVHNHDSLYLGIAAKAADSDKLDNHDTAYFAIAGHNHDSLYVGKIGSQSIGGPLGIGIANPRAQLDIYDTDINGIIVHIKRDATTGGYFNFQKSKTTDGLGSNNKLGTINFQGSVDQGATFILGARIIGLSQASWSSMSAPGYLSFSTTPSGSITVVERMCIDKDGNVGIGTTSPTEKLDVNSDAICVRTPQTPASAGATGTAGMICWDANYIYVCVATNTWKRTEIATW